MSLDTKRFIKEIEKRPCIWDVRCDDFANKQKKKDLWLEMYHVFFPNFDEIPENEKCQVEIALQKKWRNLKSCFLRELKKQKFPNDNGLLNKRQYLHFNHLLFLLDIVEYRSSTLTSAMDDESIDKPAEYLYVQSSDKFSDRQSVIQCNDKTHEETKQSEREKGARRRRSKTIDNTLLKLIKKKLRQNKKKSDAEEDVDKLFLLSLLPEMKQIPKEYSLSAKTDILLIMQKWKNF